MKIDGTNLFPETQVGTVSRPATSGSSGSQQVDLESESDTVLGGTTIARLAAQLQGLPEIRRNQVDALRQAIQNGQYNVSNRHIADALYDQLFGAGVLKK
jgi:flagellar biosynthesis anti-sigma factor FlgM